MKSRWFDLRNEALEMRKKGCSIREIEKTLRIPKSTLSGWFKNILLSKNQQERLRKNWLNALLKAREKAVIWHNQQKATRIVEAQNQAIGVLSKINTKDKTILELALAMLYLGEGFKTQVGLGLGNSDPAILKFFISTLRELYGFDIASKIKCELHLRTDQNPTGVRRYWSEQLGIPLGDFTTTSIDKRTAGKITYPNYKGVCVLRCGNIALQRRLLHLAQKYCEQVVNLDG